VRLCLASAYSTHVLYMRGRGCMGDLTGHLATWTYRLATDRCPGKRVTRGRGGSWPFDTSTTASRRPCCCVINDQPPFFAMGKAWGHNKHGRIIMASNVRRKRKAGVVRAGASISKVNYGLVRPLMTRSPVTVAGDSVVVIGSFLNSDSIEH
jgi:hypothetical protein